MDYGARLLTAISATRREFESRPLSQSRKTVAILERSTTASAQVLYACDGGSTPLAPTINIRRCSPMDGRLPCKQETEVRFLSSAPCGGLVKRDHGCLASSS